MKPHMRNEYPKIWYILLYGMTKHTQCSIGFTQVLLTKYQTLPKQSMATFNSQIPLDYSPHSFSHLSFASHPHSPCYISRVSLVSAITLPCLSRFIINRNHRAKSLAFIIRYHPAISLAVDHYPQSRFHVSRVSLLTAITVPNL